MRDPDAGADQIDDERRLIGRLKRRADFVRASKGRRAHGKAATVQAVSRPDDVVSDADVRVGFTLTRKVGNAVIRNRARRRLKEATRLGTDLAWRPAHDYVIVGRIDAIRLPFEDLTRDLARTIRATQGKTDGSRGAGRTRPERTRPTP